MATPPDSPGPEEAFFDFESTRARQQTTRPVPIEELLRQTKFSRQEIRVMYRGFKQGERAVMWGLHPLKTPPEYPHEVLLGSRRNWITITSPTPQQLHIPCPRVRKLYRIVNFTQEGKCYCSNNY
ncbi:uncharacterized protein LOC105181138 isoform X1 [Harpegnathos saltator]|uniref:uncharacterized protein LOC105181138 isoform X1 n=1 Tax=Harpegnathos saltator TaxID=610380 RepID=UPI00094904BE|nr:uncharacterized protein LOC105181138 isoform X1 [Harpegnathos saltator]